MAKKAIFMGTTQIAVSKTLSEIMGVLVAAGARQISSDYGPAGEITAVRFTLLVMQQPVCFALPTRVEPLLKHCRNDRAQAARVAFRQVLRWVQAQLAMIEVGMVKPEEVYAPYMLNESGQTLYHVLIESRFKALPAPKDSAVRRAKAGNRR
jgi:hypothetical protein